MSAVDSPEFQKALKEACDSQWGNWLFGGGYKTVGKKEVPKALDEIQNKRKEIEEKANQIRRKAKGQMSKARAMAVARGITMVPPVSFENLTPEEFRAWAEKQRRKYELLFNPQARRIMETVRDKIQIQSVGLICPKCGGPDRGNKMNRKPWCFKCKVELIPPDKIGKWVDIKKGNLDDTYRRLRGLPE